MAITTRTYDIRAGASFWNSDDVISTLKNELSDSDKKRLNFINEKFKSVPSTLSCVRFPTKTPEARFLAAYPVIIGVKRWM